MANDIEHSLKRHETVALRLTLLRPVITVYFLMPRSMHAVIEYEFQSIIGMSVSSHYALKITSGSQRAHSFGTTSIQRCSTSRR